MKLTWVLVLAMAVAQEVMTMCCDQPLGILAADEYLENCICGPKDADLIEWVNHYKWNVLMSADNKTDLNTPANNKILCKVAPFINCLFKDYFMHVKSEGHFYGVEAREVINKTKSDRALHYQYFVNDLLLEYNEYYTDGSIPPLWNVSIDCTTGTGAKKKTKSVYLGNVFLTQYFLTNMYYQCPNPMTDPLCVYKWDRYTMCHSDLEYAFYTDQKANLPQWLSDLKKKNQQRMSAYLTKYKKLL